MVMSEPLIKKIDYNFRFFFLIFAIEIVELMNKNYVFLILYDLNWIELVIPCNLNLKLYY
ncbi:hypothetical protein BpHYR1_014485 [Brachionus plicatilis]|uniref:Uncharacterized protein n=1 Tax=Brachionus plicatilis TaxID=10195 RepID=A0A3M7R9M6_BRAPC|nr:hypothetical protein BpHYR1_014485 [Brachionus plicatilis]